MPIKILDPQLVSKIAAGEVVERPASVVKELVENSLDAGADHITVEAEGGAVSLIKVTDNGCGIPSEEVELAFNRHATSKISSLDDLEKITTLGFRGEALPSIAAVADVEMTSQASGADAGNYVQVRDGSIVKKETRGRPRGTTITVRYLFRHIPARLKFLKSAATENSHIANLLTQYAFSFPGVKFELSVDGRVTLRTPGNGNLRDTVAGIYGPEIAGQMREISGAEGTTRVNGLASPPSVARSSRSYLSFFVNHRWVHSNLLNRAAEDAYHGMLMTGRHPIVIINLSLPPEDIDVNVHPAKNEVKFRNNQAAYSAVSRAVRNALQGAPLAEVKPTAHNPALSPPLNLFVTENLDTPGAIPSPPYPAKVGATALPILRVVGQLSGSYIMAEGPAGLYLIDQHAAHERILFEKMLNERSRHAVEVQGLLEPFTVELTPMQEETLSSRNELLKQFGFTLEHFGGRSYLLRAVPAVLQGIKLVEALTAILDSIPGDDKTLTQEEEKIAYSLACHGAIKAGETMTQDAMKELVRQLEGTSQPKTCPHGRPTMIHLSSHQLAKEFGRTS
jgi:DNA mismatch repair protein MutL